jgi:serine/threonine protein kinase
MKPENVLIGHDGYAKLTDFGLSKEDMGNGRLTKTICGTTEYLAPEVLMGEGYNFSCDWWSYGCLLYELMVGAPPFYSDSQDDLFISIFQGEPNYPSFLEKSAVDLIKKLLLKNPKSRL